MRNSLFMLVLVAASTGFFEINAQAAEKRGVQLSLVSSIQLFEKNYNVVGARFGFIDDNKRMTGFDFAGANLTEEVFKGVGVGVLNYSRQETYGLQLGAFNHAGSINGCQLGLINHAGDLRGLQVGLLNRSGANRFLQFGVINIGENATGWQLGVFNINSYWNAGLPAMILLNGPF